MSLRVILRTTVLGATFAGFFSSCSAPHSTAGLSPAPVRGSELVTGGAPRLVTSPAPKAQKTEKKERTGIATGWGREVVSEMSYTDFKRAAARPKYVSTIRYNDQKGADQMGVNRRMSGSGMQKTAGGLIEWGMSSGWGMLNNYWWRGSRFVIGKKGREYEVKIKNLSDVRLEVVLSIDGLDVIDGKPASTKKRGYIVGAGKTLSVKGFRTSQEKVATFKFSSVSTSYANLRHGETRNVGILGLAIFTEKGKEPGAELQFRQGARPFAEAPTVRARD